MSLSSGAGLGPSEVVGPLVAGAMDEVYRAIDTNLRRQVAIKALRRDHRAHDGSVPPRLRGGVRASAAGGDVSERTPFTVVLNWFEELNPRP